MDGPFGPSDEVVLASAVYFKGAWASRFDKRNTQPAVFQLQNGQEKRVLMMMQHGRFFYQAGRGLQAVCLPYTDRSFAMSILLPAPNSSVAKLLSRLDAEVWENAIWRKFRDQAIELNLPRFRLEYGVELKKPLEALGMSLAFYPRKADFSGMAAEPLFISRVSQRAAVEVDEQGTEAAAATFGVLTKGITPSVFVDRPFLFLIHHLPTKSILFMGIVYDPEFLGTSGELDSLKASSTPVRSRPREF
jgi:serpin B